MLYVRDRTYVVLDFEATYHPLVGRHEIIEIGCCKLAGRNLDLVEIYHQLIKPSHSVSSIIKEKTGITDAMLLNEKSISDIWEEFMGFLTGAVIVGHQVSFDLTILSKTAEVLRKPPLTLEIIDTLRISKKLFPHFEKYTLSSILFMLGLPTTSNHRALSDAQDTSRLFQFIIGKLEQDFSIYEFDELKHFCYNKQPVQKRLF